MSSIRVVRKRPGEEPEEITTEDDLDSLSALIAHGQFEMLEVVPDSPPGLDLWANEEGKYASYEGEFLAPNLEIFDGRDYVMGTVFVAGSTDDGDTRSLTKDEVWGAIDWLNEHAVTDVGAMRAELLAAQFR